VVVHRLVISTLSVYTLSTIALIFVSGAEKLFTNLIRFLFCFSVVTNLASMHVLSLEHMYWANNGTAGGAAEYAIKVRNFFCSAELSSCVIFEFAIVTTCDWSIGQIVAVLAGMVVFPDLEGCFDCDFCDGAGSGASSSVWTSSISALTPSLAAGTLPMSWINFLSCSSHLIMSSAVCASAVCTHLFLVSLAVLITF
jgi:hypothetical protein